MPLHITDVSKSYPTRHGPLTVLQTCSFSMSDGKSLAVLGPSGSGKTTLLSIIGTLETPTSGKVELHGMNPLTMSANELAAFRQSHIGFVFQENHLLPQCTALENVLIPALACGTMDEVQSQRGEELLERVGLSQRKHHFPAELSGGERQRVAIARAMLFRPKLLLADEPTGNLDRSTAITVIDLLQQLQWENKVMLLIATHDLYLADRLDAKMDLAATYK